MSKHAKIETKVPQGSARWRMVPSGVVKIIMGMTTIEDLLALIYCSVHMRDSIIANIATIHTVNLANSKHGYDAKTSQIARDMIGHATGSLRTVVCSAAHCHNWTKTDIISCLAAVCRKNADTIQRLPDSWSVYPWPTECVNALKMCHKLYHLTIGGPRDSGQTLRFEQTMLSMVKELSGLRSLDIKGLSENMFPSATRAFIECHPYTHLSIARVHGEVLAPVLKKSTLTSVDITFANDLQASTELSSQMSELFKLPLQIVVLNQYPTSKQDHVYWESDSVRRLCVFRHKITTVSTSKMTYNMKALDVFETKAALLLSAFESILACKQLTSLTVRYAWQEQRSASEVARDLAFQRDSASVLVQWRRLQMLVLETTTHPELVMNIAKCVELHTLHIKIARKIHPAYFKILVRSLPKLENIKWIPEDHETVDYTGKILDPMCFDASPFEAKYLHTIIAATQIDTGNGKFPSLRSVEIEDNIKTYPLDFAQMLRVMPRLRRLKVLGCDLLPSGIENHSCLEYLEVTGKIHGDNSVYEITQNCTGLRDFTYFTNSIANSAIDLILEGKHATLEQIYLHGSIYTRDIHGNKQFPFANFDDDQNASERERIQKAVDGMKLRYPQFQRLSVPLSSVHY